MRKTLTVIIDDPKSRDHNKSFRITEMSSDTAERWAFRALLALANAGARMPEGALDAGMAGIHATFPGLLIQGIQSLAGLRYEDAAPLLDEMLGCVDIRAPGTDTYFPLRGSGMTQVEEVSTLLKLRYETFQLHLNFSLADALSKSKEPAPAPAPSA